MINESSKQKIKKFYEILSKVQSIHGKNVGLIVVKEESLADISALSPNSNLTTIYDLAEDINITDLIEQLADNFKKKRIVIIRLYDYLDPKLYNQIYLISKAGRMEFFKLEKDIIVDIPEEAQLILVSKDDELEKLNYKNLFNIVGPILRL